MTPQGSTLVNVQYSAVTAKREREYYYTKGCTQNIYWGKLGSTKVRLLGKSTTKIHTINWEIFIVKIFSQLHKAMKFNLIFSTANFYYFFLQRIIKTLWCTPFHVLVLDTHTCNCVAGSVMSIRDYFRQSNGVPEPTGSLTLHAPSQVIDVANKEVKKVLLN